LLLLRHIAPSYTRNHCHNLDIRCNTNALTLGNSGNHYAVDLRTAPRSLSVDDAARQSPCAIGLQSLINLTVEALRFRLRLLREFTGAIDFQERTCFEKQNRKRTINSADSPSNMAVQRARAWPPALTGPLCVIRTHTAT
jgi:hypothetical protein